MLVVAGIGAVFYYINNVEGDLVGDRNNCQENLFTPTNPDTEESYTSLDDLREDLVEYTDFNESQAERHISDTLIEDYEKGDVVQLEGVCQ